jgi:hypothetical protein
MSSELTVGICRKPLFIIGSPRSGTSVLAWALAQHSDFWTSGETDFLYHLFGHGGPEEAWALSSADGGWLTRHDVDRSEFMSSVGLGMNALITKRSGGRRWVDQSPTYTAMATTIAELFPDALFAHILRDGRNVVQSMTTSGFRAPWAKDFIEACRTWAWFVDRAVAFAAQAPERCVTIPYDFLSESPEACFTGILEFLDAEYDEAPAEFIRTRRINSSYQPDGPRSAAYLGPRQPWQQWTKQQRKTFREEAGHAFVEYGFGTEHELAV